MDQDAPEETVQNQKSLTLSNEKMQQLLKIIGQRIRVTGTNHSLISGKV